MVSLVIIGVIFVVVVGLYIYEKASVTKVVDAALLSTEGEVLLVKTDVSDVVTDVKDDATLAVAEVKHGGDVL